MSGTTRVSRYQEGKPIWILLKQETVSGSGISWAICKSAPRYRQITMPAPRHSVFTGQMPFLPPNQQRQSTEGIHLVSVKDKGLHSYSLLLDVDDDVGWYENGRHIITSGVIICRHTSTNRPSVIILASDPCLVGKQHSTLVSHCVADAIVCHDVFSQVSL